MTDWLEKYINKNGTVTDNTDTCTSLSALSAVSNNDEEIFFSKFGLELSYVKSIADSDWEEIKESTDQLEAFIDLIKMNQKMQQGIVPDSYCYQAYCDSCGSIPLYINANVMGCPWCLLGGYQKVQARCSLQENNKGDD